MGVTSVAVVVDGGGTKTDVVAVSLEGKLIASRRGPRCSPQAIGVAASVALVDEVLARRHRRGAGRRGRPIRLGPRPAQGTRRLPGRSRHLAWARQRTAVDNDLFAWSACLGTESPDAIAVVVDLDSTKSSVVARTAGRQATSSSLG